MHTIATFVRSIQRWACPHCAEKDNYNYLFTPVCGHRDWELWWWQLHRNTDQQGKLSIAFVSANIHSGHYGLLTVAPSSASIFSTCNTYYYYYYYLLILKTLANSGWIELPPYWSVAIARDSGYFLSWLHSMTAYYATPLLPTYYATLWVDARAQLRIFLWL